MAPEERLTRLEWLRANGFALDPFPAGAEKAESDELFDLPGLPAYVDPPCYEKIRGTLETPGPRFIFSNKGGGKSSLRRRIKWDFENSTTTPRALVLEYLNHEYGLHDSHLPAHTRRITRLVSRALANPNIWQEYLNAEDLPCVDWLQKLVEYCRSCGYDGIYLLVDCVDLDAPDPEPEQLKKILPLIVRSDIQKIDRLVFKYFIPDQFLKFATGFEDQDTINLSINEILNQVLEKRLFACLDSGQTLPDNPLGMICDTGILPVVERELLKMGELNHSPGMMWKLGHLILDELFKADGDGCRRKIDLINQDAFQKASERFLNEMRQSGVPALRPSLDGSLIRKVYEELRSLNEKVRELKEADRGQDDRDNEQGILTGPPSAANTPTVAPATREDLQPIQASIDALGEILNQVLKSEVQQISSPFKEDLVEKIETVKKLIRNGKGKEALETMFSIPEIDSKLVNIWSYRWSEIQEDYDSYTDSLENIEARRTRIMRMVLDELDKLTRKLNLNKMV